MRVYAGFPSVVSKSKEARIRDFHSGELPTEAEKKLLSLLENLSQEELFFTKERSFSPLEVLESLVERVSEGGKVKELIVPSYASNFKALEKRFLRVVKDYELFGEETLLLNVGFTKTSLSLGGRLVTIVPLGHYHFVDALGNYLFNRAVAELSLSNAQLRREGIRGELLKRFREEAEEILIGEKHKIEVLEIGYGRKIPSDEVSDALSHLLGRVNYGDVLLSKNSLSAFVVSALYRYEEKLRERFKLKEVVAIGAFNSFIEEALRRIIPLKVKKLTPKELLLLKPESKKGKRFVYFEKLSPPKELSPTDGDYRVAKKEERELLRELRTLFKKRDLKGLALIEELSRSTLEEVVYELLSIVKRCSFKDEREVAYLNYAVAALSRMEIDKKLLPLVVKEMERVAFVWEFPLETMENILYFCHAQKEAITGTRLERYPFVFQTYARSLNLTEGEKAFLRSVASSVGEILGS